MGAVLQTSTLGVVHSVTVFLTSKDSRRELRLVTWAESMFAPMLMVVLGAGASYDSLSEYPPIVFTNFQQLTSPHFQNEPRRPPLAAQLFEHERFSTFFTQYPECLGLFPQLDRVAKSTGLEQRLAELVGESEGDPIVRQQMVALRFYIREVVAWSASQWQGITRGADNYAELLGRIDRWRRRTEPNQQVALVTFNYDVLLDQAAATTLPSLRRGFAGMPDYVQSDEYKFLKVHGSTNWLRLVAGLARSHDNSYSDVLDYTSTHQLPSQAHIVTETEAASMGTREADIPAIAIPVQEKSAFEMPPAHEQMLANCIGATTDLIVIGWRGMERHFLDLWHAKTPPDYSPAGPPHLKRVLIVDKGEGAQVVEAQLRNVGLMDGEIESLSDGFTGFLRGDRLETFLSGVLLMPDRARV